MSGFSRWLHSPPVHWVQVPRRLWGRRKKWECTTHARRSILHFSRTGRTSSESKKYEQDTWIYSLSVWCLNAPAKFGSATRDVLTWFSSLGTCLFEKNSLSIAYYLRLCRLLSALCCNQPYKYNGWRVWFCRCEFQIKAVANWNLNNSRIKLHSLADVRSRASAVPWQLSKRVHIGGIKSRFDIQRIFIWAVLTLVFSSISCVQNYSARSLLLLVSEWREPGFSGKRIARVACERHARGRARNSPQWLTYRLQNPESGKWDAV